MVLGLGAGACGGGGGASVASFCTLVKQDHASFAGAKGKAALKRADAARRKLADNAPGAVKGDMKILAAYFDDLEAGNQTAAVAASSNVTAASAHLEAYVKAQCKIDLVKGT